LGLVSSDLDEYLQKFLTQGVNPFASWRAHVDSWLSAPLGQDQLLIIRFEDLRVDPFKTIVQIVQFLADHGAKLDVKDSGGMSPIDAALGKAGGNSRGGQRIDVHEDTAALLRKLGAK